MPLNKQEFPTEKHPLVCAINIIGCPTELEAHCAAIEKLTAGVITKEELRPDIFKGEAQKKPSIKQARKDDIEKAKAHITAALTYINVL